MKTKNLLPETIFCLLISATPSLAAQAAREDHSGLVVWVFLGFCALIVMAQLVPAMLLLIGMVKGLVTGRNKTQNQSAK